MQFQFKAPKKKSPQDLVAVDMASSGLKVVHLKKQGDTITVLGADIFPALNNAPEGEARKLDLPKPLMSHYAALAFTGEHAIVRVVSLPGHVEAGPQAEQQVRETLGLDAQYRVAFTTTASSRGKQETKLLTVAVPEADAQAVLAHVSEGAPAPYSLELAGLSALNACLRGPASQHAAEAVCIIECGARVSYMAIFNKGSLILARKIDVGGESIAAHVQKQLGLDAETAQSILSEGAIDISQAVREVIEPFLRQLTISRDFVEREENCRIRKTYISGGMSLSTYWTNEIRRATGMEVVSWNPFEMLTVAPGALPERLEGQQPRFAAAIGAALGVLSEDEA
jgi:Tfp pilus assembly PilM family ATPase